MEVIWCDWGADVGSAVPWKLESRGCLGTAWVEKGGGVAGSDSRGLLSDWGSWLVGVWVDIVIDC